MIAFASCARVSRTRRPAVARRAAIVRLSLARAAIAPVQPPAEVRRRPRLQCDSRGVANLAGAGQAVECRVQRASSIDVTWRAAVT